MSATSAMSYIALTKSIRSLFVILAFGLISACSNNFTGEISPQALYEKIKNSEKPIILDVRSESEYADAHIPEAMNIPHNQIENVIDDINDDKEEAIYIYCESGRRADLASAKLKAANYSNIIHVTGDMPGWLEAELPSE